jgi:hypothetical protein
MTHAKKRIAIDIKTLLALLLFAVTGPLWAAAGAVGTVTHLSGIVSVRHADGSTKLLSLKSEVLEGDLLSTENETFTRIKFIDGGEVVLRPNTQFKVDKYSFDAADASGDNAFFSLVKGGLRAASGLIGKRSRDKVGYGTVVATIGIRGTYFVAHYCDNDCGGIPTPSGGPLANGLHVSVTQGMIVLSNGGGSQDFAAGQFGFTPSFTTPPVVVPPSPGLQFNLPMSFSAASPPGSGPAQGPAGTQGAVDCEVR